jgi:hypothetical protein
MAILGGLRLLPYPNSFFSQIFRQLLNKKSLQARSNSVAGLLVESNCVNSLLVQANSVAGGSEWHAARKSSRHGAQ